MVERVISVVNVVVDLDEVYERFEGIILKYEEFYCEMNFF